MHIILFCFCWSQYRVTQMIFYRRRYFQFGAKIFASRKPSSGGTSTVLAQCHCVLWRQPSAIRTYFRKSVIKFCSGREYDVLLMSFCLWMFILFLLQIFHFLACFLLRYCRICPRIFIFKCYFVTYEVLQFCLYP